VPVTKTPIAGHCQVADDNASSVFAASMPFDVKEQSRHILFCGTHVIQTRYYGNQRVKAVVIRTGMSRHGDHVILSLYLFLCQLMSSTGTVEYP